LAVAALLIYPALSMQFQADVLAATATAATCVCSVLLHPVVILVSALMD